MRRRACVVVAAVATVAVAVPAHTKVRASQDERAVVKTFVPTKFVRKADFPVVPPNGNPIGMSDRRIAKFPRAGSHFGILSTGNVKAATRRNKSEMTSYDNKGPVLRGTRDLVMVRVKLRVPENKNCLLFNFKFLSEEFPEYVDSEFNDAFIAELGKSTWFTKRQDPAVESPRNFARDANGNPIRVNSVGDAVVKRKYAKGSTYDAATRTLRASTPVKPGKRILFLSIFDQGDRQYDSAVFLDALRIQKRSNCETGVVVDQ